MTKTEAEMTRLLDHGYSDVYRGTNTDRWVRAAQVRSTQAFWGVEQRICDYGSFDKHGGGPQGLHGDEIKVSRSDWLAELRSPEKSELWRSWCNFWWIVAPSLEVVQVEELPAGCGLLVTTTTTGQLRAKCRAGYQPRADLAWDVVAGVAYATQIHRSAVAMDMGVLR